MIFLLLWCVRHFFIVWFVAVSDICMGCVFNFFYVNNLNFFVEKYLFSCAVFYCVFS